MAQAAEYLALALCRRPWSCATASGSSCACAWLAYDTRPFCAGLPQRCGVASFRPPSVSDAWLGLFKQGAGLVPGALCLPFKSPEVYKGLVQGPYCLEEIRAGARKLQARARSWSRSCLRLVPLTVALVRVCTPRARGSSALYQWPVCLTGYCFLGMWRRTRRRPSR